MKIDSLIELVQILRKKCPWDRVQTIKSLKNNLIEEAYEFVEAVEENNPAALKEEAGDILFLIIFLIAIMEENGITDFENLLSCTIRKYKEKHPHVFKDKKLKDRDAVIEFWNRAKPDPFKGIPKTLPALSAARIIQERAARLGFDWRSADGPVSKIKEEIEELIASRTDSEAFEEFGDLLFACVNLARHLKIDPEDALRYANKKFVVRFKNVLEELKKMGKDVEKTDLEEMDMIWNQKKQILNIKMELDTLKKGLDKLGITYDKEILQKFNRYLELLYRYRGRVHLLSKNDYNRIAVKHFLASLLAYKIVKGHKMVCDIGAGAGFPSIPLKIFYPGVKFVLFESKKKKAYFLLKLIDELQLKNIVVLNERAEAYKKRVFDLILIRAAGQISKLIKTVNQLLIADGEAIFYKGLKQMKEIDGVQPRLKRRGFKITTKKIFNPINNDPIILVIIKKVCKAPSSRPGV